MVLLHQRYLLILHSIHLISMSSLMNVKKLRGHAPLSILRMNLVEKISFPVGYVIGLSHHSPLSIWMKPKRCWITILLHHTDFHLVTGDSPFHHAGGMQTSSKHSFSFQACVNMKLNPSIVPYGSSLCKNEPISILTFVIAILSASFIR